MGWVLLRRSMEDEKERKQSYREEQAKGRRMNWCTHGAVNYGVRVVQRRYAFNEDYLIGIQHCN